MANAYELPPTHDDAVSCLDAWVPHVLNPTDMHGRVLEGELALRAHEPPIGPPYFDGLNESPFNKRSKTTDADILRQRHSREVALGNLLVLHVGAVAYGYEHIENRAAECYLELFADTYYTLQDRLSGQRTALWHLLRGLGKALESEIDVPQPGLMERVRMRRENLTRGFLKLEEDFLHYSDESKSGSEQPAGSPNC